MFGKEQKVLDNVFSLFLKVQDVENTHENKKLYLE